MSLLQAPQSALNGIQSGRNYIDNLANKAIVKPKFAKGIGGFVFDYNGQEDVTWAADITDHYVENNTPVQDHIAIKPLKVVLRGFIAELVLQKPQGLIGALDTIQNRLTAVPAYLGRYTPGAIQDAQKFITKATNTVNKIDQAIGRIKNIVGFFTAPGETKQTKAFNTLLALANTRQVMVVETPYKVIDNMAIENVTFIQDDNTRELTDISVTLKEMRFVDLKTTTDINANRRTQMSQTSTDKGKTSGTPVSAAYKGFQKLGWVAP